MSFRISIIIPALDEAYTINETISHLKRLDFPGKPEIIVVDGRPNRNTVRAIRDQGVIKIGSSKGRAIQMNAGAKASSGDLLLFLHADTLLPEKAPALLEQVICRGMAAAGAFDLGIRSEKFAFRIIEKMVYIRTRLTRVPYGDQAIFVKRTLFETIGGYNEIPIMEDVDLMLRIQKVKEKIKIIPHRTLSSSRRWQSEGVVFCTLRNWVLITLYCLGVSPRRLSKFYV